MYRVYTKTETISFPVIFKCENCGKYNISLNPFSVNATYSDQGTFKQEAIKKRADDANDLLYEQLSGMFCKIATATENNDFKNAGYRCICSHCNTKPKWSFFKNHFFEEICEIAFYISIFITIFFVLLIIDGNNIDMNNFLIPLSLLAITYIPRFVLYQLKKFKISKMEKEYMPLIFNNKTHFNLKLNALGLQSQVMKNAIDSIWLCDNCKKTRNQIPCEHCGSVHKNPFFL